MSWILDFDKPNYQVFSSSKLWLFPDDQEEKERKVYKRRGSGKRELGNLSLQGSNSSGQFPDLASQTIGIAEKIDKNPPLEFNLL